MALADDLRARYPTEMTIVLQHEFWGLEVEDDRFSVLLKFGGVPQRLEIPFEAVTVFADPSVEFGLQFARRRRAAGGRPARHAGAPSGDRRSRGRTSRRAETGSAEVVTLDRFRKK